MSESTESARSETAKPTPITPAEFLEAIAPWPHTVTAFSDGKHGAPIWLRDVGSADELGLMFEAEGDTPLYFNPARPTDEALDWIRRAEQLPRDERIYKLAYRKRNDIAGADVLWADIDPTPEVAADEAALAEWRAGLLDRVSPLGAHLLVDSGRGCWLFWLLDEQLGCGGLPDEGEPLKGWLKAARAYVVEQVGGADSVTNPDRVARLPGSINQKTGKAARAYRLREGRTALAELPFMPPPEGADEPPAEAAPAAEFDLDGVGNGRGAGFHAKRFRDVCAGISQMVGEGDKVRLPDGSFWVGRRAGADHWRGQRDPRRVVLCRAGGEVRQLGQGLCAGAAAEGGRGLGAADPRCGGAPAAG